MDILEYACLSKMSSFGFVQQKKEPDARAVRSGGEALAEGIALRAKVGGGGEEGWGVVNRSRSLC